MESSSLHKALESAPWLFKGIAEFYPLKTDDGTDYRTVIKEKFCIIWDKNSWLGESATSYQGITQKDQTLLESMFDKDINTYKMQQTSFMEMLELGRQHF